MMNKLDIDGVAGEIRNTIEYNVRHIYDEKNKPPKLLVIKTTDDVGTNSYYKQIEKTAKSLDIDVVLKSNIDSALFEITNQIAIDSSANADYFKDYSLHENVMLEHNMLSTTSVNTRILKECDGILVLLPIKYSDNNVNNYRLLQNTIPQELDVDRISTSNGNYNNTYLPATVEAVMDILEYNDISIAGKHVVVLGRSENLGLPFAREFINRDGLVTVLHSKVGERLPLFLATADIIISTVGKAHMFSVEDISNDAVVIDVGCSMNADGKLCGDFNPDGVENTRIRDTPVPHGVGEITTLELLLNTVSPERKYYTTK